MKDLFVFTADADAEAVLKAILRRHRAMGIREVSYQVQRFDGRDAGMVKEGPEMARKLVRKQDYSRLVLLWDFHGCGAERRGAQRVRVEVETRLAQVTWLDRSAAVLIDPELEEWVVRCWTGVAKCLRAKPTDVESAARGVANSFGLTLDDCIDLKPKELFQETFYRVGRRQPLPGDFGRITEHANLRKWESSPTFSAFKELLESWFPPTGR